MEEKKTYITWEENNMDSLIDDEANIYPMEDHRENNECFTVSNTKWYLDKYFSKHMTGDKTLFFSVTPKKRGLW